MSAQANLTVEQLMVELEAMKQENNKLKSVKTGSLSFRVSAKGAVSVYGLGRFPITLYATQWTKLFTVVDSLKAFINDNQSKLATKE